MLLVNHEYLRKIKKIKQKQFEVENEVNEMKIVKKTMDMHDLVENLFPAELKFIVEKHTGKKFSSFAINSVKKVKTHYLPG